MHDVCQRMHHRVSAFVQRHHIRLAVLIQLIFFGDIEVLQEGTEHKNNCAAELHDLNTVPAGNQEHRERDVQHKRNRCKQIGYKDTLIRQKKRPIGNTEKIFGEGTNTYN